MVMIETSVEPDARLLNSQMSQRLSERSMICCVWRCGILGIQWKIYGQVEHGFKSQHKFCCLEEGSGGGKKERNKTSSPINRIG